MVTLAGEIDNLDASLLDSETISPPLGAGADKVTAKVADCPSPTEKLDGKMIDPKVTTVIVAVASTRFAAVACTIAVPTAPPATDTIALEAFGAKLTVAGTVATEGLFELRATVKPPEGAGAERFRVRFCAAPVPRVKLFGEKVALPITCMGWLVDRNPGAEAVMFATPGFMAVTWGVTDGLTCPAETVTLAGETVTFEASLEAKLMVTPLEGAGEGRATGNGTDRPSPIATSDGTIIGAKLTTVTPAVLSGAPGTLARIVATPGATPVTGTWTLLVKATKLTLPGTVAIELSLELK